MAMTIGMCLPSRVSGVGGDGVRAAARGRRDRRALADRGLLLHDAPPLAAAALASTERLAVGLGILPAVSRTAAVTAMEIATLASIAPGRVVGGIGHGIQSWMAQMERRRPRRSPRWTRSSRRCARCSAARGSPSGPRGDARRRATGTRARPGSIGPRGRGWSEVTGLGRPGRRRRGARGTEHRPALPSGARGGTRARRLAGRGVRHPGRRRRRARRIPADGVVGG